MGADPHAENRMLRRRLEDFTAQAHKNERKLRRFQTHELHLIGLNSLYELIQNVLYPDRAVFDWDIVTLVLLDPEYEICRTLEEEGVDMGKHKTLMLASRADELNSLYSLTLFPYLGPYRAKSHAALFATAERTPASVALLPLVRHGKLIGNFNIGSHHIERFVKGVRTDFMEHLAAVIAICIENAMNLERLKRQGLTDTLTGVNNRRFFDQRLDEELKHAQRDGIPLSCLLLDVDHFKQVNDNYGHQVGDQVLREVAFLIRAQLRGSDVISRYGGEEFVALLRISKDTEAVEVAERIRQSISSHLFQNPEGGTFKVTISIGLATYVPTVGKAGGKLSADELIGHADRALYEAKSLGRDKVVNAGEVDKQGEDPR